MITNPVSATDSRPMIQLQGYSATPLASLFFDVTNDSGVSVLNRQGFVVDQHYDTNTFAYTTNYFQCFDIPLALGSNTITLRATDWAGNTALTNLLYMFSTNDDTTAPVITLAWPQDGMKLIGNSFTLRGRLDDPTATVAAQIVSPDGTTNALAGLVERNGLFWVEQMPIAAGTNTITVSATDAAGNLATTNLTVVQQSDVQLTMDAVAPDQLHQLSLSIGGTVSPED